MKSSRELSGMYSVLLDLDLPHKIEPLESLFSGLAAPNNLPEIQLLRYIITDFKAIDFDFTMCEGQRKLVSLLSSKANNDRGYPA
jgi:hypothetical protein